MPPKAKKIVPWVKCERCFVEIPTKDMKNHVDSGCPSEPNSWTLPYIDHGNLYTYLDCKECEEQINITGKLQSNVILINQSTVQSCGFVIGEPVTIESQCTIQPPFCRRVWPINSTNLTTVFLTEKHAESGWLGQSHRVLIQKLASLPLSAATIYADMPVGQSSAFNSSLAKHIQLSHIDKIVTSVTSTKVSFYGKDIILRITKILSSDASQNTNDTLQWFLITNNTKWILNWLQEPSKILKTYSCIGGCDKILEDINSMIAVAFRDRNDYTQNLNVMKSVLLYGPSGTGKSALCKHVAAKSNVNIININGSEIYSKFYGETEAALKKMFAEAVNNHPSIIIIDEIDTLCPKRTSTGTDQEKRILSTFSTLLDNIHEENNQVFILANSNKPDMIDPSLRRYGRIDCELEIPVPNGEDRLDIFMKVLSNIPHQLSIEEIETISGAAHGYVGADICNLCTRASMHMLQNKSLASRPKIDLSDFEWALKQVKPSSMREVLIAIPNVKWSDIGGSNDLKQKLKQAVEWPIKYSESFSRLGIEAPSGLLMYGPPGCSKTMIAKALANESGLNFLSIKGPELFSKWVGESERAVRELFRKARQVAPSIIFFDEIDALGGERSKHNSGSNVQERVLAQILTELDGISPLGNVTVVAATNRPDKIDSALLRPGRLDRIVYVPLPDEETRKAIFELKLAKMALTEDLNVDDLVNRTDGYSGAEIQAVCHEAALHALEENIQCTEVSFSHFSYALEFIQPRTPQDLIILYEKFEKCYL